MKAIKIVLALTLCNVFFSVQAQNVNVDSKGRIIAIKQANNENIEGSQYIDQNFTPLIITQFKDQIYSGRFNAWNGEMEVKIEEGKIIALDNNIDFEVKFTLTNRIYRTETFVDEKGITKNAFLAVVEENHGYTLLKEEKIKFHEEVKPTSSYERGRAARYIREKDDYYIKHNDTVNYISQKKKDLYEIFPNLTSEIKSFIKKNKLNLKNEDDLVKIVRYLGTIED